MNKIYLAIFAFILLACKSSNEAIPSAQLTLTIYYDSATKAQVSGATVYLFSDFASFQAAITGSEIASNSQSLTTNASGQVTFTGLSPQNYWVYVSYQQNGQTGKAYNNTNTTFSLKNPLTTGSITQAVIYLKQSPYYVTIEPPNTSIYPLNVTVGTNTFTIASYSSTPIYVNVNPGVQQYTALGGAKWGGPFTVSVNQSSDTITNTSLNSLYDGGLVVFWTETKPAYPVTVYLSKATDSSSATNEVVGIINASRSIVPTSTDTANTANIFRDYNTAYNYKAVMISNTADTSYYYGAFELKTDSSFKAIQLPSPF